MAATRDPYRPPESVGEAPEGWIDKSFIVQALFADYIDQFHSHELEFRSHIYDPPFACFVSHDGSRVTSVELLETKDW